MIDLNEYAEEGSRFDLHDIREQLCSSAYNWLPALFPNAVMARDRRSMRCGDLTGRAPSGNGSCIIHLAGPRAGTGKDFADGQYAGPIDLIEYATGLSGKALIEEAARIAGANPISTAPKWQQAKRDPAQEAEKTAREIARTIERCKPLAGTLGVRYLEGRGLGVQNCADLLFTDDLTDRDTNRGYNGLVAIVRDAKGERTGGILRIFLTDDGTVKAEPGKKMLGPVAGGAVQLAPVTVDGHVGVAEGLETSLAAMQLFSVPCWATLSTSGMKLWNPPASVRRVTIFADAGEPGLAAANELATRLQALGIAVEIREPLHGDDFNHDLQQGATAADYVERPPAIIRIQPAGSPIPVTRWGKDYDDFWTYLPMHKYLYVPSRDMWPGSAVDAQLPWKKIGDKDVRPSSWLSRHRAVEQMTWQPGSPEIIEGYLIQEGEWVVQPGVKVFNQYKAPDVIRGDASQAGPWCDHIRAVYPDEADHLFKWFAHRVQRPGEKINHALVLGGSPGVGKDSMIEPLKYAVGGWNFAEISPKQLLGRFNGFVKSIVLRISEARDLGDVDRYAFYDASKVYMAAPPNVLRCDEKHLREYAVANVCGVLITTNYKTGGLYLAPDDRRHFVAWTDRKREDFSDEYWTALWRWYDQGGRAHVAAFLAELDISSFNAKAPPRKTPAFWEIADSHRAPEDSEMADVIDELGNPNALTLDDLRAKANDEFRDWLNDRKNRRAIPHRLDVVGYAPVRNPKDKHDGHWKVNGRRQAVYVRSDISATERMNIANEFVRNREPCR